MNFKIMTGDNRETLKTLGDNSVDAIVTDPPYGIDFLGKSWDANTGALETYKECLRVLKPGGYILAFSAARTYHHLAITLEQAGFEIRDQLMWLYASGFPKAQDIGKAIQRRQGVEEEYTIEEWEAKQGYSVNRPGETMGFGDPKNRDGHGDSGLSGKIAKCTSPEAQQWEGWKTALKPAHEPVCMARKPFKGSTIDNVLKHGVGALNIDATRIALEDGAINPNTKVEYTEYSFGNAGEGNKQNNLTSKFNPNEAGRFPSNVIGEVEGYQKYFYCPKVSRKERHCGFEQKSIPTNPSGMYEQDERGKMGARYEARVEKQRTDPLGHIPAPFGDVKGAYVDGERMAKVADDTGYANVGNNHPTVKPVALMRYLIKLVTPPNSVVLDPFTGSGSTGMAAVELGHEFIGCELDPNYVAIAEKRIRAWNTPEDSGTTFETLFE